MMFEPRRLHPTAIIFNVIYILKNLIYVIGAIVIASFGDGMFIYVAFGIGSIMAALIIYSILAWFRFKYSIVGDELKIEQGLIIRKERYISKNRIQSIDLTQGVIHRIFKLTKVQIETAGSDQSADASLSAVTFTEGEAIRQELKLRKEVLDAKDSEDEAANHPTIKVSPKRLIIAGSTSGSVGVILALFFVAFSEIERFIPEQAYDEVARWMMTQTLEIVMFLAILLLVFLWILGILGTVIKYGNFQVTRQHNELFITRGLLEKRQMTLPLKRIQAFGIKESLIRQPLGFATLYVEIAGGEVNNANARTLIFPIIKTQEIESFLQRLLPEYQQVPTTYTSVPKRAFPYYLVRTLFLPVILFVMVLIYLSNFIVVPIVLMILGALLGWLRYHTAGYHLDDEQLTIVMRDFGKDTLVMKHSKVQSMQRKQNLLHRKQQLATVRSSMLNNFAGRHAILKEVDVEEANRISDWFSLRGTFEHK
ncbi:PH domain-containing protein [Alkalibacillus aidingensis]|uniref:PH domain-containing protein n=1 Tax=Alkalibacillus aidingensis TaxID=2747607 RepID=UPI00166060E0|nr:PH domain-containing protein [Alkalibacillus aidingensis]